MKCRSRKYFGAGCAAKHGCPGMMFLKGDNMKYALTVIVSMFLVGCDSTADQAPGNLQKGDEYFAAKQYEVAEYVLR